MAAGTFAELNSVVPAVYGSPAVLYFSFIHSYPVPRSGDHSDRVVVDLRRLSTRYEVGLIGFLDN